MNDVQKKIVKLLWDFQSLREEHINKLCLCDEKDINYLIANKVITKDKNTNILKYMGKEVNNRNIVAFDVVMDYLERKPEIKKSKYPINVSMKAGVFTYDIIAIKEIEMENLFENIDKISTSDRIIIIIETKEYQKRKLKTKRPCYICTYPPLEIVDRIN